MRWKCDHKLDRLGAADCLPRELFYHFNRRILDKHIIESCRRCGIDPYAYLRDVLTRLPTATNWQIKDLTPEAWAKTQRSAPLPRVAEVS